MASAVTLKTEQMDKTLEDGEVLVKVNLVSLDPSLALRATNIPHHFPILPLGSLFGGYGSGSVLESKNPKFPVGTTVSGMLGWQTYYKGPTVFMEGISGSPELFLGCMGLHGMVGYCGMIYAAEPKAGDVVVVSGAAGAVGSIAAQVAKSKGCRVVGIAGGPEKCTRLLKELKLDVAVDYKSKTFEEDISDALPDGANVFFDTVGGSVSETVFRNMARYGKVVLAGHASDYKAGKASTSGFKAFNEIMNKRLTVKGFDFSDFAPHFADARKHLEEMHAKGELQIKLDVRKAPLAEVPVIWEDLLNGDNNGKLMVDLSHQ